MLIFTLACLLLIGYALWPRFFDKSSSQKGPSQIKQIQRDARLARYLPPPRESSSDRDRSAREAQPAVDVSIEEAKKELLETRYDDPYKKAEAYRSVAERIGESEGPDREIQFFRKSVQENPDNSEMIADLGLALIDAGRMEEALALLQEQLEKDPRNPEALFGMGVLHSSQGNLDEAEKYFKENLSLNPDHLDTKYNLANLYTFDNKSNPEEAERYYQEVLIAVPDNLDAQNGLAAVYLQTGRIQDAIELWERITQESPQESVLFSNLGEAYFKAGRYDDATQASDRALANNPDNADAYYYKALAEKARGNLELYERFYQEARARDPDLPKP